MVTSRGVFRANITLAIPGETREDASKTIAMSSSAIRTTEDALQILRFRLTDGEMHEIVEDSSTKISQRRLQDYLELLG